jgi:PIN domain nuclease of toxin-antitoxin system
MERIRQPELVYLDTHIAVWLYDGLTQRLSPSAIAIIETGRLFVSSIVELEIQYLHEIGRFRPTAHQALDVLSDEIGLQCSELSFRAVVRKACQFHWTRDPFDRLIVAEAVVANAPLVTKDTTILTHYAQAVW